jgi:excisionase family DNA binding protein
MVGNYLSIKQASKYLGCSPATLRAMEKRGKILPLRFGSRKDRKYSIDQLNALLTSNN